MGGNPLLSGADQLDFKVRVNGLTISTRQAGRLIVKANLVFGADFAWRRTRPFQG
jgi:hypothetical protein